MFRTRMPSHYTQCPSWSTNQLVYSASQENNKHEDTNCSIAENKKCAYEIVKAVRALGQALEVGCPALVRNSLITMTEAIRQYDSLPPVNLPNHITCALAATRRQAERYIVESRSLLASCMRGRK
jgi:hypothetical protein